MIPETPHCVAIMARSPRAGAGPLKTRLAPMLPDEHDRATLYRGFLVDAIATVRSVPSPALRLAFTPAAHRDAFSGLGVAEQELLPQRGDDLGARERHIFEDLFVGGFERVVLIGSDLPTLPASALMDALRHLDAHPADVVLGPAADGGYYLIGLARQPRERSMHESIPDLFTAVRWSSPFALADTGQAAARAGRTVRLVQEWYDVDDEAGLKRLIEDLRDPSVAARAPATLRALAAVGLARRGPPEGGACD